MLYKYNHSEYFKDIPQPDYSKISGNIILYGAGVNGVIVMRLLKKRGIDIICFADSDKRKHGTEYFGYPVISPGTMREKYPDAVIIITPYLQGNLVDGLKALGYKKIYDCSPLFLEFETDDVEDCLPPTVNIFHVAQTFLDKRSKKGRALTVVITERCTLRCIECMAFAPYYEKPVDYDYEELCTVLDRVLPLGFFPNIYLEGGETFLHKDFDRIIKKLISYQTVEYIWVITNGTIIPGNDTLELLKDPKIIIWISDYGEHSYKMSELKECLKAKGISHHSTTQHWYKVTRAYKYDRSEEETQHVFDNCCKGKDIHNPFLIKNRIYRCQFNARSEEFGVIPACEADSVNVISDNLRDEIESFLMRKKYIDACKYCWGRGYSSMEVPVAEQAAGKLPPLEKIF
ncbi:MAG: radical SAM protein [Acetivibrionales bacterium]